MNAQCYRIIFNQARGLLMAVAETAPGRGKGRDVTVTVTATPSGKRPRRLPAKLKPLARLVWRALGWAGCLGGLLMPAAQAQIVADPGAPGNQRPTVLNAFNGVPLVNIQTPSAAGVSRNAYRQFDVQTQGAILNNSHANVQTQLGGWVQGNPWLATGSARVILNEVHSSDPSLLQGYLEVAGPRAQVVIANPAGVSCDGCGFINAHRATLTTGTPILDGGRLTGYRVQEGTVSITGLGLDAASADYTEILARAVQINAGLWANQLAVVAGANQIDVDPASGDAQVTASGSIPGTGPAPAFAIDTALLGGMYAGQISLIASEAGVGVRHAGKMYAGVGDVVITANGRLENAGHIASGGDTRIRIDAQDGVQNTGIIYAQDQLSLDTRGDIDNTGGTISATRIDLQAGDGHTLTNRGLINGGETLLRSQTLDNLGTGRIYGDHVAIGASTLDNRAEDDIAPVIAARERLDIGALTIDNSGHALLFSGGDIAIGGSLDAGHRATGQAETLNNASARIEAMGALEIAARILDNTNPDFSTAIEILAAQSITEYQGAGSPNRYAPDAPDVYIYNDESDHLHTPEGNHESWSAYRYTRNTTETRVQSSDPASITAGGNLRITADTVNNDKSHIIAGGTLGGTIGTLNNTEVAGERVITDTGTVTSHWRNHESGRDNTGSSVAAYLPAPTIQAISLTPTVYLQNTAPVGSGIDTRVPDSRLFGLTPDPAAHYLIETDPAFADYRTWLSSDYLLAALALDPATTQKRLGDGYYEQKLVREQVAQLTGRRFLAGHADDEAQYAALMDNGLTFAQAYDLIPGVALSAAQMAALTSDIVWLVAQDVTLADGSTTQALVPQVYVRLQEGDLQAGGALIAGQNVRLDLSGDLFNSGTIAGRELLAIGAENVQNLQGRILGNTVQLAARADLGNIGGLIAANEALLASAGRDLTVASTTRSQENAQGSQTNVERIAGLYVTGAEGVLLASAGRDMSLVAAAIQNQGTGRTQLIAQRDLTLGTVTQAQSQSIVWDAGNRRDDARAVETGTVVATQGDLMLAAGQDLSARAAEVSSQAGALAVAAGRDLRVEAGQAHVQVDEAHQHTGRSSAFSSKTVTTRDTLDRTTTMASTVSGETVNLSAGNDVAVRGSNLVSDTGTVLAAGRDLAIEAATETRAESHFRDEKKSGLFSTGGLGITIGTQQQSVDQQGLGQTATASTVGSVQGDVRLLAGEHYRQTGSDVLAPEGNVSIAAQTVDILEARETSQSQVEQQFKQSGLTVSLSSPVISAIQTVQQVAQAAGDTRDDGRMQALAAASAGLAGYQGYQAVVAGQAVEGGNLADQAGGVSLAVSLGSSKSQSTSTQASDTAAGSTVAVGGDVTILAMGDGERSDITLQGSTVSAGRDVHLIAEDEIRLLAAENTANQQSSSHSSSASVGVSLNLGAQTGLSVGVSASKGTGRADGDDLVWTNTNVSAGETARLASGGDTTLKGAIVSAPQVIADVGGNLAIESLQDTSTYDSQQRSSGFSISVPILGAGGFGGSVGGGKSKIGSTYASVTEQSGIRAGDGGFDVQVGGDTTLTGGAITSTQPAIGEGKNHFETGGELSLADITNHAEYEAKGASINLGAGISLDGKLAPQGTSAGVGEYESSASSMTLAAISGIAGHKDARTGDKETGIAPIFDAEKVQKEIDAQVQITATFWQQASKAVGDYAEQQLRQASILRAEGKEDEANAIEAQWGENGTLRLAAHTLIGGLTGGASGAAGAAAGTLTAPAVADALANAGIDGPLATTLTGLASTAAGALAGGSAGTAAALNEVGNNYLSHLEEAALKRAKAECARIPNSPACAEQTRLENLDRQRDEEIQPLIDACRQHAKGVNCDAMARHYAETNGFGYASAKYESSSRSGSPFSFNGKLEGEGEDAHYVAPQIKMKDGTTKTDPGGLSYGMFQLSSERGGLEDFLNYLKSNTSPEAQNFYQELTAVGGLSAARAGNSAFVDKFMELTQRDPQFIEYQFESINQGSNMTRIRKQLDTVGQSFDALDTEHKEVIFSSSVQHGGGGTNKAVQYAFSPKLYDEIETRYGLRLMEYQEAVAEGKKLQSQATTLESQAKTLESQAKALESQKSNLLQQQVNLLQQGQQAGTGQIQDLQRQINALDQKIEAQNTNIEAQNAKIDAQNAKVTANDKLIQETKAWLVKNAKDSIEDGERFIHDIYEWRIKNNPGEAKTRYIPERDMLLQQLRDRQQQNNKK